MRVIVTGAAGFIGSHIASFFGQKNHTVLAIDNFNENYARSLKNLRLSNLLTVSNINFLELDLCDEEKLTQSLSHFMPDAIIHLAAQPGVRIPISESYKYIDNNIKAFTNILQFAVMMNVPNFVYASSSSVYGDSTQLPYQESSSDIFPISVYGATKRANELLVSSYVKNSNTRARGLRFFTVYGPWGRPDMAYFRIISSVYNDKIFKIYGDGKVRRDFTYIDDVVEMTYLLNQELTSRNCGYSDIVNVGGGQPHTILELINIIEKTSNKILSKEFIEPNQNDTKQTCASTDLLHSLITFKNFINLEEGVKRIIDWTESLDDKSILEKWIEKSI